MSMQAEQIRECIRRHPFRPFLIHLADGRSFRVPHPEFAAMSGNARTIIVTGPGPHESHRIDAMLVTSLTDPAPSPDDE